MNPSSAPSDTQLSEIFEQYVRYRTDRAGAITPRQRRDLLMQLLSESETQGVVPAGPNSVMRLNVADPAVQAVIKGEAVSTGGQTIKPAGFSLANMSPGQKFALLGGMAALTLGLILMVWVFGGDTADAKPTAVPTRVAVVTVVPTVPPAPTQPPLPTQPPPPTPFPPTPTPQVISLAPASAPSGANDPASIEISKKSFTLSQGAVKDGVWQPKTPEWLNQTLLRRVIALPATNESTALMVSMKSGDVLRLRLRSGEIVDYRVIAVSRVKQYQIETLSGRDPSLVVFLSNEKSTDRWLATAVNSVQEGITTSGTAAPFGTYVPSGASSSSDVPAIPADAKLINSMTTTISGLKITISGCRRVASIEGQQPPPAGDQYVICVVTAQAEQGGVSYNGSAMAIGEQARVSQFPTSIPVAGMLGDGVLNKAGESVTGQVAGIISATSSNSSPVLAWIYGGAKYLLTLKIP